MLAKYATITDVGRIREKNEDNFYAPNIAVKKRQDHYETPEQGITLSKARLFGVFDGMGGYSFGEVASEIAAAEAERSAARIREQDPEQFMADICDKSNDKVCKEMRNTGNRMGTTASMVHVHNNVCTLCNIGDSPIFLFRDGEIKQISKEHTEREMYEKITGKKTDRQKKFKLTQNIGIFPEELQIEPYFTSFEILEGDYILLCSDGLTDMVSVEDISSIISDGKSPETIVSGCVKTALENGGKDNVTVVCIHFEKEKATMPAWLVPAIASVCIALIAVLALLLISRNARENSGNESVETFTQTTSESSTEQTDAETSDREETTESNTQSTSEPTETTHPAATTKPSTTSKPGGTSEPTEPTPAATTATTEAPEPVTQEPTNETEPPVVTQPKTDG